MRVGDRRLGATQPVAERTRVGPGRARSDLELTLGRDPGDRAAARPHRHHVDHRELRRVVADGAFGGQRRLAVQQHRDVGRRAAAVAGEHLRETGPVCDHPGTQRAGGRPGEHGADRLVHHLGRAEHPAVRPHHRERQPVRSKLVQSLGDAGDVAGHGRLDGNVDQGGHRPLVLAVLTQHLAGQRDHGLRMLAAQHLAHRPLVLRVRIRVQEADPDHVHVLLAEPARHLDRTGLVERADLVAAGVQPAAHGEHPVGRHDPVRLDPEVGVAVSVRHRLPADLEQEPVAVGGDEAEPADLPLQQLVGGHRGSVADRSEVLRPGADQGEHLVQPGDEAVGRVRRGGRRLAADQPTGDVVQRNHVGERAAGVDADPDRHPRTLPETRPPPTPPRAVTSRATCPASCSRSDRSTGSTGMTGKGWVSRAGRRGPR